MEKCAHILMVRMLHISIVKDNVSDDGKGCYDECFKEAWVGNDQLNGE